MKFTFSLALFTLILVISSCGQIAKTDKDLALQYLVQEPITKQEYNPVVILLHGYGSDEKDLFELKKFFPKNYLIVSARAPQALPQHGYQWYEMSHENGRHSGKKSDLEQSRELILKFINQIVIKYKADPKQVYLIGFSQGAMMSYYVGLATPDKIKGIAPLSGMIIESLKADIKVNAALKQLKIFIANGTADSRITFADGKAAYDYLLTLGLQPEFHAYAGMEHQISKNEIDDLMSWLVK